MVKALSNKVGRPTKYNKDILAKANAYLDNFNDEHGHMIPSVVGLGKVLRITRETLYQWAKDDDKKEFSDILQNIVSDQEFELINGGLSGALNSNITKLVLGKHGYSDKQDQNVVSDILITVSPDDESVL